MAKPGKSPYAMSGRLRTGIIAVCVLAGVLLVWLDHSGLWSRRQGQDKSEEQRRAYDLEKYHAKTFRVVSVVDGDTIDIDVPDGEYEHTRIRLWGIDTPETKNPKRGVMYFGPEAAEFTKEAALGREVRIYLDEGNRTRGYYGRVLGYVQLGDESFLNEVLVSEGLAYAELRFRHSLYNKYKQLESAARGQKKGLWREVTREQLPEWLQKKKPTLLLDK